jgi:pimeloyl-ACP methyl ester carboxylesterase
MVKLAVVLVASVAAEALFDLPSPTGRHPVGTTSWRLTDSSRPETLVDAAGANRQVEVLAWYPAASPRGELAPYLREGRPEAASFASLLGGPADAFDRLADVRTHARLDAPVAAAPPKLPLLVFSHGYGSLASAHTALLEDLASHGYIVLSIVHPYEAVAATLDGGRVVSFIDDSGKPRQAYRDVIAEWRLEDETMAAVTQEAGEEGQRRLLREYLSGLQRTHVALRRWVDDTKLVIDRFLAPPREGPAASIAARADSTRIGVFGHSMGGVTAAEFCLADQRCRAGLNLDGIPQYGSMIDKPLSRPFLMVYSARPGRAGASDAIYRRAASPYYRVDVRDTLHLDFSDMMFWGGPLRDRNILGSLAPARVTEITRAIVRQYFDQVLLGRRSSLLAGESSFPEVTVKAPEKR